MPRKPPKTDLQKRIDERRKVFEKDAKKVRPKPLRKPK